MRRLAIALAGIIIAVGVAAVATGAIPDADGNFYACVKNSGEEKGSVRIIDKTASCKRKETRQHWPATQGAVQKTYVNFHKRSIPASTLAGDEVSCNAGDVATGGGVRRVTIGLDVNSESTIPVDVNTQDSDPISPPTGWSASYDNLQNNFESTAIVFVVCLEAQ